MRRRIALRNLGVARIFGLTIWRLFHRAEAFSRNAFADKFAILFNIGFYRTDFPFFARHPIAYIAFWNANEIVERNLGRCRRIILSVETDQYLGIWRFCRIGRCLKLIRTITIRSPKIELFNFRILADLLALGIEQAIPQIEIAITKRVYRTFVLGISACKRLQS